MPNTLIAGNWKMNKNAAEAVELARAVKDGLTGLIGAEVVLCPPAISLIGVRDAVQGSLVKVGAQNMHFEESGAFTGEISPLMLRDVCDYVILGHSERRQFFGETDELVNQKVRSALQHGLRPIMCVGETLAEREGGQAGSVIEGQVRAGLAEVIDIIGLVVAYEPIWAIGTGRAATPEIAAGIMGGSIQETLRAMFGPAADEVPILYGGSVNPGNVTSYMSQDPIHGALVGGASLQADQFVEIVKLAAAAK
ncbi:MAG: triose-phosphate isomerase [Chloroflexi bacterium]|nr:triose-phosphate isomerase [Chloroflexota bacterium]MDA1218200.1 triose-phosphate isomerase [Chloroflexota bacterium]